MEITNNNNFKKKDILMKPRRATLMPDGSIIPCGLNHNNETIKKEEYFKIPNFKERCKEILEYYSPYVQIYKTVEETTELNKELLKFNINSEIGSQLPLPINEFNKYKNNILNELADVYIMLNQIKIAFRISENEIGYKIDEKLKRQLQRINDGQK